MLNKGHNIDIEQDSKELRKQAGEKTDEWERKREERRERGKTFPVKNVNITLVNVV